MERNCVGNFRSGFPFVAAFFVTKKKDFDKLNWSLLVLLGGGFALALALENSGVTRFVGNLLQSVLAPVPTFVCVLSIATLAAFWTEVSSNV